MSGSRHRSGPTEDDNPPEEYTVSDLTREVTRLRVAVEKNASRGRLDRFVGGVVILLIVAFVVGTSVFNSRTNTALSGLKQVQTTQQEASYTDCLQRNAGQAGTTKLAAQVVALFGALNAAEESNTTAPATVTTEREKAYQTFLTEISTDIVPAGPVACQTYLQHP